MAIVSGTISGTGSTAPVAGSKITIKMDFAGTASVDVEEQMPSGAWIKIDTGVVADYRKTYDSPTASTLRLTCTAFTNSVEYLLESN